MAPAFAWRISLTASMTPSFSMAVRNSPTAAVQFCTCRAQLSSSPSTRRISRPRAAGSSDNPAEPINPSGSAPTSICSSRNQACRRCMRCMVSINSGLILRRRLFSSVRKSANGNGISGGSGRNRNPNGTRVCLANFSNCFIVGWTALASQSANFGNLSCRSAKPSPARSRAQRMTSGLTDTRFMQGILPTARAFDRGNDSSAWAIAPTPVPRFGR